MSSPEIKPDYEKTAQLFAALQLDESASNIHGSLAGLLSSGKLEALTIWFEELFVGLDDGDTAVQEARQICGALFKQSKDDIDQGLGLTPFLPNDNQPLSRRAVALAEWCQGFLYGLGISGIKEAEFSVQTREALHDFAEMAQLEAESIDENEDGEIAFNDLYEFIRVATMQICDDLIQTPDNQA
ncbi:MAG: UPF0149 family protein [Candidatus Polarisedimenticolaceae bacterium]|nr:UPF0149 family protein [Candidatus Polarisedimenticolaceae bacterium]